MAGRAPKTQPTRLDYNNTTVGLIFWFAQMLDNFIQNTINCESLIQQFGCASEWLPPWLISRDKYIELIFRERDERKALSMTF